MIILSKTPNARNAPLRNYKAIDRKYKMRYLFMMSKSTVLFETVEFDDPSLANALFGPHNAHLEVLALASGANIVSRGASVIVKTTDQHVLQRLCNLFVQLYEHVRQGQSLSGQDVSRAYSMLETEPKLNISHVYKDTVFVAAPKKTITARNLAQKDYYEALFHKEMVFALGPAGTGKTYLAVAMAINMLNKHRIKKIILTRPAVEAGERLGFLPGDLADKVNPYLRPLYDALYDMLPPAKVASMLETNIIEIAPLAFMRGRTLNDAFIILDEAQNTTHEQMKMFLTRLGFGSRAVITGDITQIDLPAQWGDTGPQSRSGLVHAIHILRQVKGIAFHTFCEKDVVRHPLVGSIVAAYDNAQEDLG